jgi:hypothetical protein
MPKANAVSGSCGFAEFLVKSAKSLICLVVDNLQAKSKILLINKLFISLPLIPQKSSRRTVISNNHKWKQ